MQKQNNKDRETVTTPASKTAREAIDTVFYGLDKLMRLFGTGVSIIAIVWFGTTCFKLGWGARDNPFLRPLSEGLLGLEHNPNTDSPNMMDDFGSWLQQETTDVLEQLSEGE